MLHESHSPLTLHAYACLGKDASYRRCSQEGYVLNFVAKDMHRAGDNQTPRRQLQGLVLGLRLLQPFSSSLEQRIPWGRILDLGRPGSFPQ